MLGLHEMLLSLSDAVLTSAGAFHRKCAFGQPIEESLGIRDFGGIVHFYCKASMEVAVSDMAGDRRGQAAADDIALGFVDAVGETRDRHAYVRDSQHGAGTK